MLLPKKDIAAFYCPRKYISRDIILFRYWDPDVFEALNKIWKAWGILVWSSTYPTKLSTYFTIGIVFCRVVQSISQPNICGMKREKGPESSFPCICVLFFARLPLRISRRRGLLSHQVYSPIQSLVYNHLRKTIFSQSFFLYLFLVFMG